ncbi:MAG TPA: MerR family DNA-binding protein [Usitatibacter sp.]|nr:MerR family DNA-binding protein [Usitatibacter sp.]
MAEEMTIGRLARAAGVNVETVRYYQRRGLLDEPAKPLGGQRRYSQTSLGQLTFIRRAQALGFSLEEVKTLLQHADGHGCREVRRMAEAKRAVLETRIAQIESMRAQLDELIAACKANRSRSSCPTIDALFEPGE